MALLNVPFQAFIDKQAKNITAGRLSKSVTQTRPKRCWSRLDDTQNYDTRDLDWHGDSLQHAVTALAQYEY